MQIMEWDREVFLYVLRRIAIFLSFIFIIVILGKLLKVENDLFLFLFIFILLRRKFGGAHVKSLKLCFVLSVIFPFLIYYIVEPMQIDNLTQMTGLVICGVILNWVGPVDSKVRPLKEETKNKLRFQGNILVVILIAANCIAFNKFILAAFICMVINLLIGREGF